MYCEYYASLNILKEQLDKAVINGLRCKVLESTGEKVLDANAISEGKCKQIPHVVLGTRASSESVSYYYINHAIFFHIPTVPSTFIQFVGRITRRNTLFPDDLNVHIFRSHNIDLYKLMLVGTKAYQQGIVQGSTNNFPEEYIQSNTKQDLIAKAKEEILWQ